MKHLLVSQQVTNPEILGNVLTLSGDFYTICFYFPILAIDYLLVQPKNINSHYVKTNAEDGTRRAQ